MVKDEGSSLAGIMATLALLGGRQQGRRSRKTERMDVREVSGEEQWGERMTGSFLRSALPCDLQDNVIRNHMNILQMPVWV